LHAKMGDRAVTPASKPGCGLRALIFDLDGTLYQNDQLGEEVNLSACRYLASRKGITVSQADVMLQEARQELSGPGKTLSRAVIALGGELEGLHERLSLEAHPEELLRVDPRVPELLKKLAGRFALHIYTNNNRSLSKRIMAQIGVSGLFQQLFTIEDSWRPKPDQAVLLGILEAIGCHPCETMFVGDRYEVDLALPESLGCAILETRTVEELLTLTELLKA
jgi:putative hydrolase of the HAD superfamily